MNEPISLSQARKNRRQHKEDDAMPDGELAACPITALGHVDGKFWFLNIVGERRGLSARQLGSRAEISALFLGDTHWVHENYPGTDREGNKVGFSVPRVCEYLMSACRRSGMYGDHVIIRQPGVWAGENGVPIAHCGDALFINGERRDAGVKFCGQIFAAAARETYPAAQPAPKSVADGFCADLRNLWSARDDGAEIIAMGLVGQSYYAAAISWRANGFITGAGGAGKSMYMEFLRAMVPISHYTTDTTKAGIEGAINGLAKPAFIDEGSDRKDQDAAQRLLDVVLSSSSGSGTKGHRGTADGGVRKIEVIGSVIMASVTPPSMLPQHRSRFSLIELLPPDHGRDNNVAMKAAIARAKAASPELFARALAGFSRYNESLKVLRDALNNAGCQPREMDHLGAILAGYWVMTQDGVPSADDASGVTNDIAPFIRGGEEMAQESAAQHILAMVLTHIVSLDRSTDAESLAQVINKAISDDTMEPNEGYTRESCKRVCERWGIRPVRQNEKLDSKGRTIPRLGDGRGIWINPQAQPLRNLFKGTPYEGDRWLFELSRLPSFKRAKKSVRIGGVSGKAIWLSWDEINSLDDDG